MHGMRELCDSGTHEDPSTSTITHHNKLRFPLLVPDNSEHGKTKSMIADAVVTPNLPRQGDGISMQPTSELAKFIPPPSSSQLPQQHALHPRTREIMASKREAQHLSEELDTLVTFKATVFEELKQLKTTVAVMTKEREQMRSDHSKVIAFHVKENNRLRDADANLEQLRALERENRRLTDDLRMFMMQRNEQQSKISDLEANVSLLKAKLKHASESNDLKQKIIMARNDQVDAKQIAVLREFQAHRLQDLYTKSRRHLEVERKQNDVLRKTLTDSGNAALIEQLKTEISALKEENLKFRKENLALKNIQFHHEKEIITLSEASQRQTIEDLDQEIMLLKMQIQRMETKEKEQRLHSSYYQSSQRNYATLDHSRAVSSMQGGFGTGITGTTRFPSTMYAPSAWNSQKEITP
ncbi:hypothetical protein BC830DRAFT_1173533 [Chytriomyces sp. MP71]|nr:hypothetical protein BC830DRAFT_1173533 [Chytriomyces sp. MP71]